MSDDALWNVDRETGLGTLMGVRELKALTFP